MIPFETSHQSFSPDELVQIREICEKELVSIENAIQIYNNKIVELDKKLTSNIKFPIKEYVETLLSYCSFECAKQSAMKKKEALLFLISLSPQ